MEAKNYQRASELKAFDETKAGVKGLVDSGVVKIPRIFYQPPENFTSTSVSGENFSMPTIDLDSVEIDPLKRKEIVNEVRIASEKWGFFQVVNHGIPQSVIEEMKAGVRRFYEQDFESKKEFYTRDGTKPVVYNSNFDLFSAPAANWRDTMYCIMAPNPPKPQDLPLACRLGAQLYQTNCVRDIKFSFFYFIFSICFIRLVIWVTLT